MTVPDGYYIITNYLAGPIDAQFEITPTANVGAGTLPAFAAAAPFSVRKIGVAGAGGYNNGVGAATGTFDVAVMTTEDVGTGKIKYYVGSNHGYTVGDIISLTQGNAIDGINFVANTNYKITDIGRNFVKFEVVGGAAE